MKWYWLVVVVILAVLVGYYYCRFNKKLRDDIIKVQIRKDMLPPAGFGIPWVQDGSCYMSDGTIGIVKGLYCQQTKVL